MSTETKGRTDVNVRFDLFGDELPTEQELLALREAAMIVIKSVATPEELEFPPVFVGDDDDPPIYKHDAQAIFDRITEFPPEAMALLDGISDDHLFTYLFNTVYPVAPHRHAHSFDSDFRELDILKPVMKALFKDVPEILEIVDELDESEFNSTWSYQAVVGERLGEKIGADAQNSVFFSLIHGCNAGYGTSRKDKITGEVTQHMIHIDGHAAQRRAALTNAVRGHVRCPRLLRLSIESMKKDESNVM